MLENLLTSIQGSSFYEFAILLTLTAIGGLMASLARQPLILVFILVGILAGPAGVDVVQSGEEIALLAKIGIAILLFVVGLKLDINLIKGLGVSALLIGGGQILLSAGFGFGIAHLLDYSFLHALLIAVALTFSSTIIIVKILSDKREIDSIQGRIALGVLIIQDLVVVLSMILLTTLGGGGAYASDNSDLILSLLRVTAYVIGLVIFIGLFMRFAALKFVGFIARNRELLLIFSIAWAVLMAALCDILGLSKELGGLLAGIALASTPYREAIISQLSSLRDFLLIFFFISLGLQVDFSDINNLIVPALLLSGFVMVSKPIFITLFSSLLGYTSRTGLLAGISLGQISEFSLIFITMAYSLGFVDQSILSLITLVALITITISIYMMNASSRVYNVFEPLLNRFDHGKGSREHEYDSKKIKNSYDVIIFGLGRYGQAMADGFLEKGKTVLAVDFNPEEVRNWKNKGRDAVYGDACDTDFFHTLPLSNAGWVISALPQHNIGVTHNDPRLMIIQGLKENAYKGRIAVSCHRMDSAERFKTMGVDLIFLPFHDAANRAVNMVLEG